MTNADYLLHRAQDDFYKGVREGEDFVTDWKSCTEYVWIDEIPQPTFFDKLKYTAFLLLVTVLVVSLPAGIGYFVVESDKLVGSAAGALVGIVFAKTFLFDEIAATFRVLKIS